MKLNLQVTKIDFLPIGVDFGSSKVKIAQLRVSNDGHELLAAGSIEIPPELMGNSQKRIKFVQSKLKDVLKQHPFRGRECVFALPADTTTVQHLKIAKVPPKEIPTAVNIELDGKLPYPISEAIVRHIVVGDVFVDGQAMQEIIAICTSKETLKSYLKIARHAGLDVSAVNVEPCAIVECFARLFRRQSDAERAILFIDVGSTSTQAVLTHGNQIVFARNLPISGEDFVKAIAEGMSISTEEANVLRREVLTGLASQEQTEKVYSLLNAPASSLVDELTQCLRYCESIFRNQTIERALFVGGQAYDKRLCQAIAQKLNLPAQIGDPLVRVNFGENAANAEELDRRNPQPNWAVAIGLSLGADQAA